jgi:hypothetical protein
MSPEYGRGTAGAYLLLFADLRIEYTNIAEPALARKAVAAGKIIRHTA